MCFQSPWFLMICIGSKKNYIGFIPCFNHRHDYCCIRSVCLSGVLRWRRRRRRRRRRTAARPPVPSSPRLQGGGRTWSLSLCPPQLSSWRTGRREYQSDTIARENVTYVVSSVLFLKPQITWPQWATSSVLRPDRPSPWLKVHSDRSLPDEQFTSGCVRWTPDRKSVSLCPSGTSLPNHWRKPRDTKWSMRRWWQEPRGEVHTRTHTHTHTHTEQLSKANCASLTLPQRACWQEQFFLETFFTLCRTQSHSSLLLLLLLLWLAQTDVRWPAGTNLSKSLSLCLCLSSEVKEAQRKKRQMKERHKQEDIISNAMVIWNTEILPHWDTMYVSTSLCVCRTHSVSVCELVYLTHCVCVGRERGGSGSSGGRDFLPASGDECGASPSATSWTSRQVQTDFISSFSFFIVFFFSIFWQINYSQNTSLGSWRESVTMTVE